MSDPDPASRSPDLPLEQWQLGVERAADRLTGRIRHCGRSAFVHLRKAWALHGVDDEMSAFRALTAEEEAATALMLALQRQRYPGAERLKPWSHVDKNAFWPLVAAVNDVLFRSGMPAPIVALSSGTPPRVTVHINMTALAGHQGEPVWAEPDEPLNFALRTGEASDAVVHMFEEELARLADTSGEKSILSHIKSEANRRNLLLYASDGGVPAVSFEDAMLLERARRVCVLLMLTIVVVQTSAHQLFVAQCLGALLRALNVARGELPDLPDPEMGAAGPLVSIRKVGEERGRISVRRDVTVQLSFMPVPAWTWGDVRTSVRFDEAGSPP